MLLGQVDSILITIMSTEQILDLIINYAYTKKEIEKHKALFGPVQNHAYQIDDAKIEIDRWIRFLIEVKHGKVDLSGAAQA